MIRKCIAIDGPAGSGKSTIAKLLSEKLKILYIDTGAMYRAVAYQLIKLGKNTKDEKDIANVIGDLNINIKYIDGEQRILLNEEDVTDEIRTPEVSMGASNVAANLKVREKLVDLQREIAEKNSVVMDGRDIGSNVLPEASLKIFLNASIEERARRRYNELKDNSMIKFADVKKDIEIRDDKDRNRKYAPLKKAAEAIEIDTSKFTISEVFKIILDLYEKINKKNIDT